MVSLLVEENPIRALTFRYAQRLTVVHASIGRFSLRQLKEIKEIQFVSNNRERSSFAFKNIMLSLHPENKLVHAIICRYRLIQTEMNWNGLKCVRLIQFPSNVLSNGLNKTSLVQISEVKLDHFK